MYDFNMITSPKILFYIYDKSIFNILSFVLKSRKIEAENYQENEKVLKYNYKTIILDNELSSEKKGIFLEALKRENKQSNLLLAVSKNYSNAILDLDLNIVKGIIYKPFDIEELIKIATNE